jgi:predicted Zn-dependent protease
MSILRRLMQIVVITVSFAGCSTLPKHGWDGKGQGSFVFSYRFIGGTHEHRSVLQEAMAKWSEVVEVGFVELSSNSEKPNIVFKWESLDGPGEMHARTAFSYNNVYVTFDLDEPWRNYPEDAFLHMALHELGHVLGLMHHSMPGSIMYVDPYVDVYHPMNQLTQEDMKNIRVLYRAR